MANRTRMTIWTALVGNLAIMGVTIFLWGWNSAGAHAAARSTARFSVLWFLAAFASPGIARWLQGFEEADLTLAFVTAHLVHFGVVGTLLVTFEARHLVQQPAQVVGVVIVGFFLVVGVGLTAHPRRSRGYMSAHSVFLYLVFTLFFLAFVRNPIRPLRFVSVLLGIALLVRLSGQFKAKRSQRQLSTTAVRP